MLSLLLWGTFYTNALVAGEPIQVILPPPNVQQLELSGQTGNLGQITDIGAFYVNTGGGVPTYTIAAQPTKVFTINLNVIEEITVQMTPNLNPYLLLLFSENQEPSLSNSTKYIFFCGFDNDSINPGLPANRQFDLQRTTTAAKHMSGNNTFRVRVPPNAKYFRAYNYLYTFNAPNIAFSLGNSALGPNAVTTYLTLAYVTASGR